MTQETQDTTTRLESIIDTTIEILDTEGLSGLSMRTLGARLGTAPTSVYWHVKNKSGLIQHASSQVWDEIVLPDLATTHWRAAGISLARELFAMLSRHPWLVQTMGSYTVHSRGKARFDDHSLAVYEMAGFTVVDADQAVGAVFMFVLGSALSASASDSLRRRLGKDTADADETMATSTAQQVEIAQEFPRLRARIESASAGDYYAAPGNSFEFGVEAIFDGLERQLSATEPRTVHDGSHVEGWYA